MVIDRGGRTVGIGLLLMRVKRLSAIIGLKTMFRDGVSLVASYSLKEYNEISLQQYGGWMRVT
jgi:hypothetical protein